MIATSEDKSDNSHHEGDKTADKLPEKSSGDRKKDRKDSSGSGVSFCHGGSSSKDGIHVPPVKIQVNFIFLFIILNFVNVFLPPHSLSFFFVLNKKE